MHEFSNPGQVAGIDFQPHYINITREFIAHRLHPCFRKCKSMHLKVEKKLIKKTHPVKDGHQKHFEDRV